MFMYTVVDLTLDQKEESLTLLIEEPLRTSKQARELTEATYEILMKHE